MMALECVSFSRIFLVGGDNETKRSCVFFVMIMFFRNFPGHRSSLVWQKFLAL